MILPEVARLVLNLITGQLKLKLRNFTRKVAKAIKSCCVVWQV